MGQYWLVVAQLASAPSSPIIRFDAIPPRLQRDGAGVEVMHLRSTRSCQYRVNTVDGDGILIVRMKMWPMMRRAGINIHPNNDPEEARDFRHCFIIPLWGARYLSTTRQKYFIGYAAPLPALPLERGGFGWG